MPETLATLCSSAASRSAAVCDPHQHQRRHGDRRFSWLQSPSWFSGPLLLLLVVGGMIVFNVTDNSTPAIALVVLTVGIAVGQGVAL